MSITRTPKAQKPAPLFAGQSTAASAIEDDFVVDVVAVVRQCAADLTAEQAATIDAALRDRWGGDRPYISKRRGEGRSDRNAAIRRDFQRGESVPFLMRRYSLCRRQILRVLKLEEGPGA